MIENFQLFLNVIIYFLNFSSIICMMFIITVNFNYVYILGDVLNNWSKGPIDDFYIVEKKLSENENVCPENYEYLFKFTWPGTKSGCDCRKSTNTKVIEEHEDKLTTGYCSISQISAGCMLISETPAKQIHSIGDKYYCIKRDTNFNYASKYGSNIFEKSCPLLMKNCGVIDTVNNYLCVEKESECPIEKNKISDEEINIYFENSEKIKENEITSKIIESAKYFVDLLISQGPVCINNIEVNLLTENIYELLNKHKKVKCPTKILTGNNNSIQHDYRFTKLINFPTSNLFYKEDFLLSNIETLPDFPHDYFEMPATIYGRNYIGWKKRCELLLPKLYEVYSFISQLEITSLIYLLCSLFILIYCMILIMIFSELIQKKYRLKLMIIVIHFCLVFVLVVLILFDNLKLSHFADFILSLVKNSCSDYETNILFVNIYVLIFDIKKFFALTIIFYLGILLLGLLKIFLNIYKLHKINLLNRIIHGNLNEFEMVLLI